MEAAEYSEPDFSFHVSYHPLGVGVLMNIVYKASVDAIEQNYRASYQSTLKNSSRVLEIKKKE